MRHVIGSYALGTLLAVLCLALCAWGTCTSADDRAVPAASAPALAAPDQHLVDAQAELAAAKERVALALAAEKKANESAAVAPLSAILHIAEGLAVTAILLGGVEIVLSMILTSLPIGKLLGEAMIASGAATLILCGLLQGALNHAHIILCWSAATLIVWAIVWLKRTGKLTSVLGIAHDSYAIAIATLRGLGKHAEADAIEAGHAFKVAEKGLAQWVTGLLARLHLIKTGAVVPTIPAAPTAPPTAPKV